MQGLRACFRTVALSAMLPLKAAVLKATCLGMWDSEVDQYHTLPMADMLPRDLVITVILTVV